MSGAGAARVIPLAAAGAVAGAAALILVVAAGAVRGAREHATGEEARTAAALYEVQGATDADVALLLDGRARIVAPEAGGSGPGAYAYQAGGLEPVAWIAVEPSNEGGRWPWAASVLALLGMAVHVSVGCRAAPVSAATPLSRRARAPLRRPVRARRGRRAAMGARGTGSHQ